MKILIDMCLSPSWVPVLERHGFFAVHWSAVGDGRAPDAVVLKWAHDNGHLVFTNDLDFGAILAATRATAPSVIQVRAQDVTPEHLTALVVRAVRQHDAILQQGALTRILHQGPRMMAKNRRGWAPGWSASHSCCYGLREDQAQAWLDQPAPG